MPPVRLFYDFVVREWLLASSLVGLIGSSLYLGRVPDYTLESVIPIVLLLALFVVVKGIERSGFLHRLGRVLERGGHLPLKLVLITFFLSQLVTIDVALVTMIPLLFVLNVHRRESLVILVALTAHAGAALTPFGTPQNLFIFSFYGVDVIDFVMTIAPFSFGMLGIFLLVAAFLRPGVQRVGVLRPALNLDGHGALVYCLLLGWVVLCVLRVLPAWASLLALGYPLLYDRASLRVDYALLVTFLSFIGLASNVAVFVGGELAHPHHVFVLSMLLSQFISNVPTTLLLRPFTSEWEALLWGVNVGGFGSLVAAMANLIAFRLYVAQADDVRAGVFLLRFVLAGFLALLCGVGLFVLFRVVAL